MYKGKIDARSHNHSYRG